MARKGWEHLSPAYRTRLERGGIDRASYSSGANLSAARGHQSRASLVKQARQLKEDIYGNLPQYNKANSDKAVDIVQSTGKKRSIAQLKELIKALNMVDLMPNDNLYEEIADSAYDTYEGIYYH